MKRKQVRVYLDSDDEAVLDRVAASLPTISESTLMTTILKAGLQAIRENGHRLELPLQFRFRGALESELKPHRSRA